jgi:hypothetical protein
VDDLDRIRQGLAILETVGGAAGWSTSAHQYGAFMSCAKQLGVDVSVVMRAASTGKLGALIEARKGSTRSIERHNTARLAGLYRKKVLGILLERDELLRQREYAAT